VGVAQTFDATFDGSYLDVADTMAGPYQMGEEGEEEENEADKEKEKEER